jgi:hypothetical protein
MASGPDGRAVAIVSGIIAAVGVVFLILFYVLNWNLSPVVGQR